MTFPQSDRRLVAILGAGPAGMSAALWLHKLGLQPWLVETQPAPGGMQQLNFLRNDWVLGLPDNTGPQLVTRFAEHLAQLEIPLWLGWQPKRLLRTPSGLRLSLQSSATGTAAEHMEREVCAVVIATGIRARSIEDLCAEATPAQVALLQQLRSLGAEQLRLGPYAFANQDACVGQRVLILGGGDNAFDSARMLLAQQCRVHVVTRGEVRAQRQLQRKVLEAGAVIHRATQLVSVQARHGSHDYLRATLRGAEGEVTLDVDRLHLLIGYVPNTDFLPGLLDESLVRNLTQPYLDAQGFLRVDDRGHSTMTGIYGAGDVCEPDFPNVVTALYQGARAAKTIELDWRNHKL